MDRAFLKGISKGIEIINNFLKGKYVFFISD